MAHALNKFLRKSLRVANVDGDCRSGFKVQQQLP
jgi:hypothetical protein